MSDDEILIEAKQLLQELMARYVPNEHIPIIISRGRKCFVRRKRGHLEVHLSPKSLYEVYYNGVTEYKLLQRIFPSYMGIEGVHQLVLHEFAHILAVNDEGIKERHHGATFRLHYMKLMKEAGLM